MIWGILGMSMGQQNVEDEKIEFFFLFENGVYVFLFFLVNFNVDCMIYCDSYEMIYRFMLDIYMLNVIILICISVFCLV